MLPSSIGLEFQRVQVYDLNLDILPAFEAAVRRQSWMKKSRTDFFIILLEPYSIPDRTSAIAFRRQTVLYKTNKRGALRILSPASLLQSEILARYQPSTHAKRSGATIVASDSIMNLGVSAESLPHVIFSFGTAPEYDP